jgi:hypothetical protein
MVDIDPFEVPPLIEWENCITHDELVKFISEYVKYYSRTPKWKWIERWKISMLLALLNVLDYSIHKKQQQIGGSNEEID